jgi:predicted nucleic acid-binding protein
MSANLIASARGFLDTNVLVYWLQDSERAKTVDLLIDQRCVISVQVLNELVNVMRKKSPMTWAELTKLSQSMLKICEVAELTISMHQLAVTLAERYQFNIYDANIIAAAAQMRCDVVYSEDMQHGMNIQMPAQFGGTVLSIRNPFL